MEQKSPQNSLNTSLIRLSSKEVKILCLTGALVLLWFIYSGHFHNGFFYDDSYLIQENLAIRSLKNIPAFFTDIHTAASRPEYQNQYRPFYQMSFAIDYYLANGLSPLVIHMHTFIGFMVLVVLCFLLAMKIFRTVTDEPFYPALLSTCCFAFHPATADVINYLYARTNSFSTLYGMVYFITYLSVPSFKKYHLYLIPLIIGCLFKTIAIVFVPLLWLYIIFFEKDTGLNNIFSAIKSTYKSMLPALLTMVAAVIIVGYKSAAKLPDGSISYYTHLLTQTHVMLNYFLLFFMPENLNPNGWRDFITTPFDMQFLTGFLFIISSIVLIYFFSLRRSARPISYGLAWFFICFIPTCAFIPLIIPQVDYYMFTSVIGLAMVIAGIALLLISKLQNIKYTKPIVAGLCVFLLLDFAYGSRARTRVWKSDQAMWEDVVKKDPTNGRVLMNLGVHLMAENKLQEADDYFEKARLYYPNYDLIYVNLGVVRNQLKDTIGANEDFRRAVDLHGWDHYEACFFYARFLAQWGHDADAIQLLQMAVQEYPSYQEAWNLLIDIYWREHDNRIEAACRQALQLFPDNSFASGYLKAYMSDISHFTSDKTTIVTENTVAAKPSVNAYISLSLVYFRNGEFEKCIEACKKALAIDPSSAVAYNNICSAYNNLRKWDEAIEAGKKAIQLQPDFALAKNNLDYALSQKAKK